MNSTLTVPSASHAYTAAQLLIVKPSFTLARDTSHRWFARMDADPSNGVCFYKVRGHGWFCSLKTPVPPVVWEALRGQPPLVYMCDIATAQAALEKEVPT